MRCALAARGLINGDVQHNSRVITDTLAACAGRADLVLLGEAFLQGFHAANFDPAHDARLALTPESPAVQTIRDAARAHATAVSFGFIEKVSGRFYSSQLTIGPDGQVLDLFRRVSPGWKLPFAGAAYCEGEGFHTFSFMGKRLSVGLCGDLWFDDNLRALAHLAPDAVLWPVYTDYRPEEWNAAVKHEYAARAGLTGSRVLYVNPVCLDRAGPENARGGAAVFEGGRICLEAPAGGEAILLAEI